MALTIPKWFDDPQAPWPCPCGEPPVGQMVLVEVGEDESKVMLHAHCLAAYMAANGGQGLGEV